MFETNPKLGEKNSGVGVEHRGVCVECSKQTQNSQTNPKVGKKVGGHRGVCVECSKQTRKQTQNSEVKNRGVYISLQIIRSRRNKKSFQYLLFLFFKKVFFLISIVKIFNYVWS